MGPTDGRTGQGHKQGQPEARGATLEESALRDPATRAQVLDTLQGEHLGYKGAGVSLASYVAADRIVEAVGGKQQPVPKEVETGLLAGGLAGAGKELIRNRTAVKAAIKAPTSVTASALRTGVRDTPRELEISTSFIRSPGP